MHDFIDPFLTFYTDHPDHNRSDGRRETEALYTRQGLIENWLEGFETAEAVLDCLEEQGIGADAFVSMVEANVNAVINDGRVYIENESGLLIPELVACHGT